MENKKTSLRKNSLGKNSLLAENSLQKPSLQKPLAENSLLAENFILAENSFQIILCNVAPVSINSAYYANKKYGMLPEAKEAVSQYCFQLNGHDNQRSIEEIKKCFNPDRDAFSVDYQFFVPTLYTKYGTISSRCYDLDNMIKVLTDVIFNERYYGENSPYRCKNLCIDDKSILKLSAAKYFSPLYKIIVTISIIPIPKKQVFSDI